LSSLAIPPAGQVSATGSGCLPKADVRLTVGDTNVGETVADGAGGFRAPLRLGSIPVGRYQVSAVCGRLLTASLDVVLGSQVNAETSTLALIIFFLLIGLWLYRRRLLPIRPATKGRP
jgi:hypothetical protein